MAALSEKTGLLAILVALVLMGLTEASRYKSCASGCCKNEFCAYNLVCYPVTKCRYGCPDGDCVSDADGDKACLPQPPCSNDKECQAGHACAPNYNLGYPTCQYNLSIGDTLCEAGPPGAHGSPLAANEWSKRSFLARWRGKAAFRPRPKSGGGGGGGQN